MRIKNIELEKVKKKDPEEMKSVRMQIRTTLKISKWMKKNKVSPSLVFEKAKSKIQESFKLRKESKELLEKAKKMVEDEIEKEAEK